MGDDIATVDTESAASPGPQPLPEDAEPVDGVTGYYALIKGGSVTVFGPDGTEIASGSRRGNVAVGRVGDARLVSDGYGDRRLSSFAELAARHHRAATDPSVRDKVWVRWEEDGVAAVYGTDKYDDNDVRAVKAGNLYWSGQRQARVTGRRWNPETRDRNLAAVLQAFARQDRNIVVLGPGQTPEGLATSPTAAVAVPAQQAPPAAAALAPPPEPEPEPLDLTGLSYEELVEAENAASVERSRNYSDAAEARYRALREERGRRLLDRVATAPAVTELSSEELAAESDWWQTNSYKTPFHSSDEEYRTLERHFRAVRTEQYARIARVLLAGPAAADLDDEALESTYEQIGPVWTRLPSDHELHDQVADYRKAVQEERIARRARSYGERTPVGEMTLEDLIAESDSLGSSLNAANEQSSYSYSEAVKKARAARLKAVDAECFQRGLEQNPDAARARLGPNLAGRRTVLIDGSDRGYGYVERQGKKFRALTSYDPRSSIGDFDSAPAAMAALVQRYDQDPETLPRRTWGLERVVDLPISAYDPLVSWLRRRPLDSREYDRVLALLTPYQLPTRKKVVNPLTNQVMQAYPFEFEEGLLGGLARIAERTTEDLREQSLDENLPKGEREAAKRRIPAMGAALIAINAVIEQVRAAGGDVERRGVDQSRLAAQMAALAGTVNEQEGGEADGDDESVPDAAAQALGGVPAAGAGGDAGPGGVLPEAGGADERGDRRGGGGPGGEPGAGDGLPGPGRAAGADQGDGAGAGAARDAAAAGGRGQPGGAAESGRGGAGGDPQGAGEPVARFRPDPADLPRGPLARAEANLEAIKVLRELESARRGATTEEKRVLARWSGWGSVPTVFLDEPDPDEPIYRPGGEWEGRFEADHARWESYDRVRGELRELLDPFEWRAASRAVLSAHYTPQGVAEAMWQGLAAYGFDGGEVLEAGCGSGAFFGVAPEKARLTGVEVDPTTAAIAARIYPHANVLSESFTDTDAPLGTFDLVIGNVPFAQAPFGERRYGASGHSLHNGFIIKQLALLRPGGYMAVITSRWTLDGEDTSARRAMSRWGDLAAAYRLPAGTFGETADTDVVADVLVFRRRAEGEEPGNQTWIDAPERELGGNTVAVNAYFTEHPEHVLGRLTSETGPYGPRVTVQGDPGEAPRLLRERMEASAAAAVAAGQGYVPHEDGLDRAPLLLQAAREKHATDFTGRLYSDDDGQIWQHVNGEDPVRVITADGVTGTEQLRMLLSLRDTASELQELDRTGSEPDHAREVRSQLARLHAAYTMTHGPLSRPRQTRMALPTEEARAAARAAGVELDDDERLPTGWGWFRQDPHAAVVLGLEHWDRANDRPVPSEVLTRRPGARRGDLEPTDDPTTALTAVMGATGGVDLPLIASLLGTTREEARRRLGTEVFDNPVTKKLEHAGAYLSGPVRVKLEQAREAAATDPKYAVNVAALEAVLPPPKRLGQFTAQLGAHWIPASLVQGFLREYLGDPTLQVSHNERYGWSLAAGKVPDAINALKGTERRSAVHIAKALLGRASMVVNSLDGDGVDEDATRAMRYKADAMRSAFEDYCTASTARVTLLTDAYNRQMNGHVVRSYDGLAPTLAGLTTERTPHPWQLSAAARMQFERGVVLAHEMGLGKTTTMVMGSQALKASGQIAKPFAVVQPHLARQWLDEAKLLYPNADIHLITSDDLADGNRRRVLEWLRANTPDLVIFTEGAFGSIRMSPEQQELYLFREIESLKEQLKRERGVPHNNFALMQLERRLTTVEARIRRNAAPMRTPGEVYWEDLGFDYALIDEAHRFTAVGFRSKEAGGETASVRAVDLHQKLRWHHQVAEVHGGRPTVTLGTGTPMENSIFEQYSVLELATPWLLDQFGVHGPDLWSETFGQKVQRIEMAPDGSGLTIVERFSRFVSKSTMKTMWGLAADTKTGDDVGIVRPKLAGGAPKLVLVDPTADQRARLQTLVARGQAIHAGDVTRDEDNMLAVSGEGRAVALDPRLVDAGAPAANKLVTAADIIAAGYHAHKDRTYAVSSHDDTPHPVPGGLFFVFCNSGTPGGNNKGGFDLYAELRDLLAARGVPRDMVQFAQEHHTPEKKAAMTDAANNGGIAVLMGSSEVLGTGFNGQNRAYALMHLDQDWTPAMMMQRDFRVLRPGNQHEEVNIYFLATKGSMDAWQVGLLTSKAEGLRDIQRPPGEGDDDNDTVEEIGASDWDYATMAAEIGGNPYMRQFMEAKVHLQGLEADRRNAAADRVRQAELLGIKEGELAGTRLAIAARERALPKITATIRGAAFRIRIGGREFDRFGEAAPVLRQAVTEAVRAHQREGLGAWKKLGTFGGLDFAVQPEIAHGSGEVRAYVGFPELRHSESRCSVEDLVKENFGATMLGRLATALEKAEDQQLMDRERLPGLEQEVAVLTAQQEAVNYGPAIEHARRRVELLDGIVGAITERDKVPELTESMLDPKKYPTEDSRRKALRENAERRAPHQANVDAAVARLAAFDAENPAPEPVVLVNAWTEDNDTDEAYEQWREQQRIIVQQNREAGLGAAVSADEPAPAPEPTSTPSESAAGEAGTPEPDGDSTEEPAESQSPEVPESQSSEPPGDEPAPGAEEPEPGFITRVTPPAGTAIDRSWWVGAYGQWDTSNVGRKGVPSAMIEFASEAEAAGWAVALRAGSVDAGDGESLLGVWECEASGTTHDNHQGGQSLAVLSLMWTQAEGAKRWTFDTERSGAELGGRLLSGYVTLADYRRALSQARVRQVDPAAKAAETDSEASPRTAEQRNTSQQPTEPTPEQESDGYGTANLYEAFGLVPPERVPNPNPQEPETDAEREETDGVPDGQMTVEEAQTEPPGPSVVLATPPTSSWDTPESLQQSEQRFGGPEQLAQYAGRADVVRTSVSSSTVWLDGRLIGYVTDLSQTVGAAHDQSWPAQMRQAPGPRFESRPPFGHRDSVSALLDDSQAAVAELVARALQMPVPRETIDADTAWTLNAVLGTIRLSPSYAGEDQEAAARLSALQQVVESLSAGQLTSTDLADDLALVHDDLLWAADVVDPSAPYLTRAAEELAVLLAATRPDDPRAWRPDPFVAVPADTEQPTPTPTSDRARARRRGRAAAPGGGTEQLGLFGDPADSPDDQAAPDAGADNGTPEPDEELLAQLARTELVGAVNIRYWMFGSMRPGEPDTVQFHIVRRSRGISGTYDFSGTRDACLAYINSETAVRSAAEAVDENAEQQAAALAWLRDAGLAAPAASGPAAFPAKLNEGESVRPGDRENDWVVTSTAGVEYRLSGIAVGTADEFWTIKTLPETPHSAIASDAPDDQTPDRLMTWLRTDSANRTLARERAERHPALPSDKIPFTLEPVVTQLEDDYWRVTRYGVEGRVSRFHWGFVGHPVEQPVSGGTPEGRGMRREYAIWTSTVHGLHNTPTEDLQILGAHFGTKKECAAHGPGFAGSCQRADPRLIVQLGDAGPVVMCVAEMTSRLIPHTQLFEASRKLDESWTTIQDRAQELVWNRAGAAQRGESLPPLADAWAEMVEEARAEKERRSARPRRASGRRRLDAAVVVPTLDDVAPEESTRSQTSNGDQQTPEPDTGASPTAPAPAPAGEDGHRMEITSPDGASARYAPEPDRAAAPLAAPLAEAEEALTVAESIRSGLQSRSTTRALLYVREAWDRARAHYQAGRLAEGDGHLATARSDAILARVRESAHPDFQPLMAAVRRFQDAADDILYPGGAGWRPAVGDYVRVRHLYVPESNGFRMRVTAIGADGIHVQSGMTGESKTVLQPTDLGPHADLTWQEQPFRAPGERRASEQERRAYLGMSPQAASESGLPEPVQTQSAPADSPEEQLDPFASATPEAPAPPATPVAARDDAPVPDRADEDPDQSDQEEAVADEPEPTSVATDVPAVAPTAEDLPAEAAAPAEAEPAVDVEDPPTPRTFTETFPLAADARYQLRLTSVEGEGPREGELRYGEITIAAVRLSATGRWFARMAVGDMPADVTDLNGSPLDAAHQGAVMFAVMTGEPYGEPPVAAEARGTLSRADVLRVELRSAAEEHLRTITVAAARASADHEQNPQFQSLSSQLRRLGAADAEYHGSRQMAANLTAVQQAVNAWGAALPTDPALDERQHLAFPLLNLLHETTRLHGRLQATLDVMVAERAAAQEQQATAAAPAPTELAGDDSAQQSPAPAPEPVDAPGPERAVGAVASSDQPAPSPETLEKPEMATPAQPATPKTSQATSPGLETEDVPQVEQAAAAPSGPEPVTETSTDGPVPAAEGRPESGAVELSAGAEIPGELPLWTGPADSDPVEDSVDVVADFAVVQAAWDEHVPADRGTGADLLAVLEDELHRLKTLFTETVAEVKPAYEPEPAAAAPASTVQSSKAETVTMPSSGELETAHKDTDSQQSADAVNAALREVDAHAPALLHLPEWQRIQSVRGAFGHLMHVIKERAGEHFAKLDSDRRLTDFVRRVSLRVCEKVAEWAQAAADKLRRPDEHGTDNREALPSAEALLRLGDAALEYSGPRRGGGSTPPPPANATPDTVNIPAMRKMGEALARPMPGAAKRVSTAAARGRSTTAKGGTKRYANGAEQAGHLRRGSAEQQQSRKPTQR